MQYLVLCAVPVNDPYFHHEVEAYSGVIHESELAAAVDLYIALHDGNIKDAWIKEV